MASPTSTRGAVRLAGDARGGYADAPMTSKGMEMQRNLWRALLLAMTVLLVGAFPAAAQSEADDGWLLTSSDDSVLIGVKRDVAVGPTEQADGVIIVEGNAQIEGAVEGIFAVDADVVITGSGASVETDLHHRRLAGHR